jgi:hypothetical protein
MSPSESLSHKAIVVASKTAASHETRPGVNLTHYAIAAPELLHLPRAATTLPRYA